MTLPTEDVAALVARLKHPFRADLAALCDDAATALSTLAGERDATIANYHELNKVSLEVISERDDALRKAAFWEKFSGVLQDDADKFKARALASEARATAAEAQVVAMREKHAALYDALVWYANPEIYKPHPHGPAFDRHDLSFHAVAALANANPPARTAEDRS